MIQIDQIAEISKVRSIDPKHLSSTRKQLHWAAQLLSSSSDALLAHEDDDSHSNLEWSSDEDSLVARTGWRINVPKFELSHDGEVFTLNGKALMEAFDWLSEKTGKPLKLRDYDMPEHEVANEARFQTDVSHLNEIAFWFSFGEKFLKNRGELRVWPHHFDLGLFLPNVVGEFGIGAGFTLGDDHVEYPYFYVNVYGIERPSDLPALPYGHWTEKWLGALLTSEEFNLQNGTTVAQQFVDSAFEAATNLLSEAGKTE